MDDDFVFVSKRGDVTENKLSLLFFLSSTQNSKDLH